MLEIRHIFRDMGAEPNQPFIIKSVGHTASLRELSLNEFDKIRELFEADREISY